MLEWWYQAQLWIETCLGLFVLLLGLFGRKPSGLSLLLVAITELLLLIQLGVSIILGIQGHRAVGDTFEFFGYIVVALFVPVAATIWALVERTRWSTVILGAAILTVAVMLVRMNQIWSGQIPNYS